MSDNVAVIEQEVPPTALTAEDPPQAAGNQETDEVVSSQEYRNNQMDGMLREAYANASKLEVTEAEQKILEREFDDQDISKLPQLDNEKRPLLYVEHMALRNRLTEAFGIGKWIQIERWKQKESRIKIDKYGNKPDKPYQRIYIGSVLIVRGCLVSETVSCADYWPDSETSSYDNTIESALSDGIRRLAGKSSLPIGSHLWLKSWRDGYWEREKERNKATPPKKPKAAPVAKPAAPKIPAKNPDDSKNWAIKLYHMYSNKSPFECVAPSLIKYERCPMKPFVGKEWSELKDGECIALWSRCVKTLTSSEDFKARNQAASLLAHIQERLLDLNHSPHVVFKGDEINEE